MRKYYLVAGCLGVLLTVGFNQMRNQQFSRKPSGGEVLAQKAYPGGFSVNVTSNVPTPIPAGQPFTLEANIVMENGNGEFEFQWLLPDSVQVVNGVIDPTLEFNSNGNVQTKITLVIPDSNMNYQIGAEAYRFYDDNVHGSVAQFNTNPSALPQNQIVPQRKKHKIVQ